jgi:hypothetical protein
VPGEGTQMLATIAARLSLGRIQGQELPGLATQLLTAGYDTLSLRDLAGEAAPTLQEWGDRFAEALTQAGAPSLTREQAKRVLLRATSADIAAGRVAPETGATQLATLWIEFPADRDLGRYYALVDDWLEFDEQRETLASDIRAHAQAIVNRVEPLDR